MNDVYNNVCMEVVARKKDEIVCKYITVQK